MKRISFFLAAAFSLLKTYSQNNNGDSLFGAAIVHDVYLDFPQTGYWDSLTANYTADVYMKCNITFDGRLMPDCGIKFKGNSSYNNPSKKKSWKIDFNLYDTLQDYNDLKKLNLNNCFKDPTLMREKVMLDYLNKLGITAPRCAYARVYLNNIYWGLYTVVEEIDKSFLKDEYYEKKGNLFKGDPNGDLKWYGASASSYYTKYELKTNETTNNWTDLVRLIDKINNSGATQFHDSLEKYMNTTSWIRSWAANTLFANLDSYVGSGHNYFIYDDSITLRFNWINWDVNEAFGNFNMGMSTTQLKNLSMYYVSSINNRPLANKMLGNTAYKSALTTEYCNQVQYYFTNAQLDPLIDSLANAIRTDVYADTLKSYSNQNFEDNIIMDINLPGGPGVGGNFVGLKPFITARNTAVTAELTANGCNVGIQQNTQVLYCEVYPNPATEQLVVRYSSAVEYLDILSVDGKLIRSMKGHSQQQQIQLADLASGIYFLRLHTAGGNTTTKKFVKY